MARIRSKTAGLPLLKTQEPPSVALRKQLKEKQKQLKIALIINSLQVIVLLYILLFNR